MSERLLEAFREEAVSIIERPDFEQLAYRGRQRRLRRHAVVGSVAAGALAVTTFLAMPGGEPRTEQPTVPAPHSATPYPGPEMFTLAEGTYELSPSVVPGRPVVRFTVPPGWNAWMGPNRFQGIGPTLTDNERALGKSDWYAGLLVLELEKIAGSDCSKADVSNAGAAGLVRALTNIPHLKVTSGPDRMTRFGYPATHLRLRERESPNECPEFTFASLLNDSIGLQRPGVTHDAWVIDVGDRPFLVWATWTANAPRREVDVLQSIVDSIEVVESASE